MLFRQEAIEYFQRDSAQGGLLLRTPAILWSCSIVSLFLCAGIAALLFLATHTQKVHFPGQALVQELAPGRSVLLVETSVPANVMPILRINQHLRLHFPGAARPGGSMCFAAVRNISAVPEKSARGEMRFRVFLQPEPAPASSNRLACPLTPDMEVEAEIVLGKVHLIDWIIATMRRTENDS
jgi:hypothetical protein